MLVWIGALLSETSRTAWSAAADGRWRSGARPPMLPRNISTVPPMDRLAAARAMVVSEPEILSGTPVIRGTRIPVHEVAASVRAGIPIERLLRAYPALDEERIALAAIYADAHPAVGRPPGEPPEGAVIVTDRLRPRRSTDGPGTIPKSRR